MQSSFWELQWVKCNRNKILFISIKENFCGFYLFSLMRCIEKGKHIKIVNSILYAAAYSHETFLFMLPCVLLNGISYVQEVFEAITTLNQAVGISESWWGLYEATLPPPFLMATHLDPMFAAAKASLELRPQSWQLHKMIKMLIIIFLRC